MDYKQQVLSLVAQLTPKQQAYGIVSLAGGILFFGLLGQINQFRIELPSDIKKVVVATKPTTAITDLPKLHLLGKAETTLEGMPNTTLQFSLKGLYSGEEPEFGSAIIAVPGRPDRVYQVGDKLPGGAVIAGVYHDRVVIDRNGQLEVLKLVQKGLHEKSS